MKKTTIGLLKETKNHPDKRAALTPSTALELQKDFLKLKLKFNRAI